MSKSFFLNVSLVCATLVLVLGLSGCGGVGASSNSPASAPVVNLQIQPTSVAAGQSATITWQSANATAVSISPAVGSGALPLSGSATVTPTQTTTYTATATNAQGATTTASATLTVVAAGATPTVTLTVTPAVVAAGDPVTVTWATANAVSVNITPSVLGEDQTSLALSGSTTVNPTADTTFTAVATGTDGSTVKATAPVSILKVALSASPATISAGQSSTLTWSSANAQTVSIDNGIGTEGPSGSVQVSPAATTTYTITATNGSETATSQATVNAPLSVKISAAPANINPGQQSTLSWTSQGALSLSIDQGIGGVSNPSGTHAVSPSQTTTYTITATDGQGNTTTAQVTVSVSAPGTGLQQIKHVIVMLQENRSFDSYFGRLGPYAASKGITGYSINAGYDPTIQLPLIGGGTGHPFHEPTVRTENLSPSWNESHFDVHQLADGSFKMDRFALTGNSVAHDFDSKGLRALGFYDQTDLPYYYELAVQFSTSDSFHSALLANTQPNRQYMFCATSQGRIRPSPSGHAPWDCPTIFSSFVNNNINFAYYYTDGVFLAGFSDWNNLSIQHKVQNISHLFTVLSSATADRDLAPFVWIDGGMGGTGLDEHPDNNIQQGAAYVKSIIDAVMNSPAWHDSVFILAYDEGGGLYDHVPPFTVVAPDSNPPELQPGDLPGDFTLSGFRVPLIVISPFVKPHFVSHTNRDLTSILKFIETRFNLPPLTQRDANADDMTEFFDLVNPPALLNPPPLPSQPTNGVDNEKLEAPPQP